MNKNYKWLAPDSRAKPSSKNFGNIHLIFIGIERARTLNVANGFAVLKNKSAYVIEL